MKNRLLATAGIVTVMLVGSGIGGAIVTSHRALASRNSAGTYSLPAGNPVVSGTTIATSWANGTMPDLATELTNSLDRNGRGGMLAALRGVDGTFAAPAFSFTSETGSGLYRIGAGDLGWAVSGAKKLELTTALFTVTPAASFSSTLAIAGRPTVTITSASGAAVNAAASMVIDSSATHFLQLTGPNAGHEGILFGDVAAGSRGYIQYNNSGDSPADAMLFGVGSATRVSITTGGLIIGSSGTAISKRLRATTSWTPGSVAASNAASTTITVTGAAAGADCRVTPPSAVGAFTIGCIITADTCTVGIYNTLASGPSTGASGTWSCVVENP